MEFEKKTEYEFLSEELEDIRESIALTKEEIKHLAQTTPSIARNLKIEELQASLDDLEDQEGQVAKRLQSITM